MSKVQIVTPGQRIGDTSQYKPGQGTFLKDDRIHSSIVGEVSINQENVINVIPKKEETIVPEIGSIVTCKVVKITIYYAKVKILCVGGKSLNSEVEGQIRSQDVRSTEIDKVKIEESFRPGDIVLAKVISLGDSRSYYLSTASNELGVIFASSLNCGAPMIPISWKEMMCSKSKITELRKVAKTF